MVLIHAPLNSLGVPRQPLRTLGGRPLLVHTIQAALSLVEHREQVTVLADDDEVALVAERHGLRVRMGVADGSEQIAAVAREWLNAYSADRAIEALMVLRPVSPLLLPADLHEAVDRLLASGRDSIQSASAEIVGRTLAFASTIRSASVAEASLTPTGAFVVSRPSVFSDGGVLGSAVDLMVVPTERGIEIRSQHDWWVCERLYQRRRIVFVVIGYSSVGLGHVYRSTLVANEFADHDVHFVCPDHSDLAAEILTQRELKVHRQTGRDLADVVLALSPDLVINDMLNTGSPYIERLHAAGARVVNFEDLGPGAAAADLVVNDIFLESDAPSNHLNGPSYYCIRDEFLHTRPGPLRPDVREVLVTFGGTDAGDTTARIARLLLDVAAVHGIHFSFVTGPGYAHLSTLERIVGSAPPGVVELSRGTKRMSEYMERADLAFSSAGRTVFELAAMQVPAIIIAANRREETHTFASDANGFVYLGRGDVVRDEDIVSAFLRLVESVDERRRMRSRMSHWDFRDGRARVVAAIQPLLAVR